MPSTSPEAPSELPRASASRRLGVGPRSPHRDRIGPSLPWVARWQHLSRGQEVAIAWDGSDAARDALWVATRLGLAVTVVCDKPLPASLWRTLDDQCVTYGGGLARSEAVPADVPVVRPAA